MTKRTRYFLMGSVAFLTVGLVAGLVAYFGGIPGAFAQAGPDELRYVPKDAVVVAYADVQQLMHSRFRQQVKEFEPDNAKGQDEFESATGINIERDVDYVLACLVPGATPAAGMDKSGFVIAKGRFDRGRIESFITSHGGRVQNYGGRKIYLAPQREVVPDQDDRRHVGFEGALAFLDNEVVAFGSDGGVKRVIDLQTKGGMAVSENAELYRMIRNVEGGNAWAVGRFDVLTKNATLPAELASRIPPITWFSATGHVNGGVSGTLSVEAQDDASAENLRQVVQGFMALARLQAGSNAKQAEMATMLNSIRLEGTGNTVAVSFSVPAEALEMLKPRK